MEKQLLNIEEVEKIITNLLDSLKGGNQAGNTPYINPQFVKIFDKIVPKQYIKAGWDITKGYFSTSLPKLLATNYSGFWFYVTEKALGEYKQSVHNKQKIIQLEKLLYNLNYLYFFVFFNSLVKKHVPYNFDYQIWLEAINKSKSRYFKQGFEYIADTFAKSVTTKLLSGHYQKRDNQHELLPLVKTYYELRHRTSQIVKPVMVIYYRLHTLKKTLYSNQSSDMVSYDTDSQTFQQLIIWWNELFRTDYNSVKTFVQQYIKKTKTPCDNDYIDMMLRGMSHINPEHLDYILKNLKRGVWDMEFWKADDILVSIFRSNYNGIDIDDSTTLCFLKVLYAVYMYFITKKRQSLLEQLVNIYLPQLLFGALVEA